MWHVFSSAAAALLGDTMIAIRFSRDGGDVRSQGCACSCPMSSQAHINANLMGMAEKQR